MYYTNTADLTEDLRDASRMLMQMTSFALDEDPDRGGIADAVVRDACYYAKRLLDHANALANGGLTIQMPDDDESETQQEARTVDQVSGARDYATDVADLVGALPEDRQLLVRNFVAAFSGRGDDGLANEGVPA